MAGAALGVGAGLGGLLAACGEEETTTTAATAGATTTEATTATTAPASTTTVSVADEMGREIKVGLVMPETGALAAFGIADVWCTEKATAVIGDGMVLGDGKKHPVTIVARDCQSDSNRAAQVAADLIQNDKVDLLMGSTTPDVTNPAADQAEALGAPFISSYSPWNAFVFGRGADLTTTFKWTYGLLMGSEQMMYSIAAAVDQIPTNKKVAFLTTNNADGNAWLDPNTGAPVVLKKYGYEIVAASQYNPGSEDFTQEISSFRKEGCDVLTGAMITPDFVNFWKQSLQQGFNSEVLDDGARAGGSSGSRGPWFGWYQSCHRAGLEPGLPVHGQSDRADLPATGGPVGEGHRYAADRRHRPYGPVLVGSRHPSADQGLGQQGVYRRSHQDHQDGDGHRSHRLHRPRRRRPVGARKLQAASERLQAGLRRRAMGQGHELACGRSDRQQPVRSDGCDHSGGAVRVRIGMKGKH